MMRNLLLPGLLGITFLGATAQQPPKAADPDAAATKNAMDRLAQEVAKVQLTSVNGQNCPVLASASRGGGGAVVQTRKGESASPLAVLHLQFSSGNKLQIAEATITLHGTDGLPRAELARMSPDSYLTEEFHLTSSPDHALSKASISPKRVVNVRWVSISELKFSDGSTWHPSESSYCHIQPNGFQRVAATR